MVAQRVLQGLPEIYKQEWLQTFKSMWKQGEHVVLLGPTGSGKTTIALGILEARDYVCVIAVKRKDETLDLFRRQGYKVVAKWPPDYTNHKVIFWKKPQSLSDDLYEQARAIHNAVNQMYLSGGWCIYFDEAGYIAGTLGLGKDIGVLLNQGRSAYLSIVVTMTRPSSVIARVPKEALSMPRHKFIFRFSDEGEIKACAEIVGIHWKQMMQIQHSLSKHDFVYFGQDTSVVVRNNTKG